VIVEGVHPLVGAVDRLRFVGNLHPALVEYLIYVFWVQVLKVIEIYRLEQFFLPVGQLGQTLLLGELLKKKQLLSGQLDGFTVLVDQSQHPRHIILIFFWDSLCASELSLLPHLSPSDGGGQRHF